MAFNDRLRAAGAACSRVLQLAAGALLSAFDMRDVLLFGGCGLVGYGLLLVYPPAAFVVPGAILIYVAVFGVK